MMDTVPPSYQSATTRDAWSIIAQYIPSSDLCAVALVCRRWHAIFMPFLWGNPASHFGTDNDDVYVALTRFRRTLKYARLEVRMLTHTLHMPPALSEIYGGPRPEWLKEILGSLPCLQSLVVSELPFFDHNAMIALRGADSSNQCPDGIASRTYNIRLLLAEREPNTTTEGIAETLIRFPELIYLDLSYTTPAKDRIILSALSQLERLQVLKLRGLGLRDTEAEFLANAIGLRVRFLDLRNNKLTDMAIRSLLQACFLPPDYTSARQSPGGRSFSRSIDPRSKFLSTPILDEEFRKALTRPLTGRSWVEDLPSVGITHLYIADNQITVEGVASLLASTRLHVLDVGTVDTAKYITAGTSSLSSSHAEPQELPGAEKLIPILGTLARENLTYLRAHHPICTSAAPQRYSTPPSEYLHELQADHEILAVRELDADGPEIHELPADTIPVFELPGSPISQSLATFRIEDEPLSARRGSAFAPEVLVHDNEANGNTVVANSGAGSHYAASMQFQDPAFSPSSVSSNSLWYVPRCSSPLPMEDPRAQKIRELLAKRPKTHFQHGRNNRAHYLHPSNVPHLETLVLTDVPSHVPLNSLILESLLQYITACSNEALLATLQAGSDYSLPPGQDRARAEQERAKSLFALRQLVLEITPVAKSPVASKSTTWKSVSVQIGSQKSSTGDRDLEQLWSAAMDDFSFFAETECGIPENDAGKYFPMAALNEKISLAPDDEEIPELEASFPANLHVPGRHVSQKKNNNNKKSPKLSVQDDITPSSPPPPEVDLVAELASFRRRKKSEYEQAVRDSYQRRSINGSLLLHPRLSTGSGTPISPSPSLTTLSTPLLSIAHHVEGHWKGEVKIVRNAAPKGRSGMVDMYGNYFEKGYLYP